MAWFYCSFLQEDVELTEERDFHIRHFHPELLPQYLGKIQETLLDPDQVRQSIKFSDAKLFSKWYDDVMEGKFVVVVVVTRQNETQRNWIITAYAARKLTEGIVLWKRD